MRRSDALAKVQEVLDTIKGYVDEHDVLGDIDELNRKYVPAQLRDEVEWLAEMAARLLDADPNTPDDDLAVTVPPVTTRS